jgi:hypothetical protein
MKAAETTLREELKFIIQEAVAAEAYEDVALIARMAGAAADAIRDLTPGDKTEAVPGGVTSIAPVVAPPVTNSNGHVSEAVRPRLLTRDQLPQFFRDGERLVKVAWSKKDKAPYTHFAPHAVVTALLDAIQAKKGEGKLFRAGEVLTAVRNSRQERYPSYQVYLALNWLREVDVISKRGRDGYVLKGKAATDERIAKHWNDLHIVNLHD